MKGTIEAKLTVSFSVIMKIFFSFYLTKAEVLSLQMKDVDLENGIITIRNAKNEKDRLVPLHFNLAPVFIRYCIAIGVNNKSEALVFPGRDENDRIISTYLISY